MCWVCCLYLKWRCNVDFNVAVDCTYCAVLFAVDIVLDFSCLLNFTFWKKCHEGKPSTWVGGWYLMLVYCCVMHNDIKQLNHLHANPWWPFPLGEGCLGEHAKEGTYGWVTVRTCFFCSLQLPQAFFPRIVSFGCSKTQGWTFPPVFSSLWSTFSVSVCCNANSLIW